MQRVGIDPADLADEWPYTLPAVNALTSGLTFTSNLAVVVGENGSGKSTLIEAIAERYGLDVRVPASLQLVGPLHGEGLLLSTAEAVEDALGT